LSLIAGGEGDDAAFVLIRMGAQLEYQVAGLGFFFVLVFQLEHRLLAFTGVDLNDDDLAGAGHLVD
jgi:hypothetical protein